MRGPLQTTLVAVLVIALLAPSGAAAATRKVTYTPSTTRYFMRAADPKGCRNANWLTAKPGSDEPSCRFGVFLPHSLSFQPELYHAGLRPPPDEARYWWNGGATTPVVRYTTRGVAPVYLNASRAVTGNTRVGGAACQQVEPVPVNVGSCPTGLLRVDVTVRAVTGTGKKVVLGTDRNEVLLTRSSSVVEVPFSIGLGAHRALNKKLVKQVSVDVTIRGWHIDSGYHELNGASWIKLPTYKVRR